MQICGPGSHDSCSSEKMDVLGQNIRNIFLTSVYGIITWRDVKLRFIHISGSRIFSTDQSNFLPTKRTGKTGRSVNKDYIYSQIAGSSWVTCLPKMQSYGNGTLRTGDKNWEGDIRKRINRIGAFMGIENTAKHYGIDPRLLFGISMCWSGAKIRMLPERKSIEARCLRDFLWRGLHISLMPLGSELFAMTFGDVLFVDKSISSHSMTAWMQVCRYSTATLPFKVEIQYVQTPSYSVTIAEIR